MYMRAHTRKTTSFHDARRRLCEGDFFFKFANEVAVMLPKLAHRTDEVSINHERQHAYSPLQLRLLYGCGGSWSADLFVDCARWIVHEYSSKVTQWWWYMFQVGSKSCPLPSSTLLDKEQKVSKNVCLWELRAQS